MSDIGLVTLLYHAWFEICSCCYTLETPTLDDAWSSRRDLGPQIGALLGNRTGDGGSLHLTLRVNDDSSVVLEVDESALSSSPRLSLSDEDSLQNLLSELRLTLLDGNHHHITNSGTRQTVKSGTDALDGNNEQVLTTRVISAVDESTNLETKGNSQLGTTRTSS